MAGIQAKTALVRAGLEVLVAREAGKRLAALGGTQPEVRDAPRRRPARWSWQTLPSGLSPSVAAQPLLAERLAEGSVLMHPFIAGELACGNLMDRRGMLRLSTLRG